MKKIKALVLMILCSLLIAFGQFLLKKGMTNFTFSVSNLIQNYMLIGALFVYALTALLFFIVLSKYDLSFVYPLTGLSYVWVALISYSILQESLFYYNWIGIIAIVFGVGMLRGEFNE